MRLEQLYIFQEIAETGSIRKASERLFLSAQSISKAMIQLEAEWNTTLYLRSRTGIQLTEAGEEAYLLIQKVIEDIAALNAHFHVQEPPVQDDSQLPVFMSCCAVMELIAFGAVNILMVDYTNTPVQIDKKSSIEIRDFLCSTTNDSEMPDIILTNEVSAKLPALKKKTEKNYHCYFLFEDELCLQIPQNDPLAEYDRIPLTVLEHLPMLLYTGTPSQKTESEQILMDWGHELQNVSRISNIETCSQIALNQHRYCFVGYPSVEFRPMANVIYVPLERSIATNQIMLVKRRRKNRTVTNAFVNSMDDYFNLKKLW